VVGYDVFVVEGNEERYLAHVANSINSYVCDGLKNGVSYVFRVSAVNSAGESEKCSVVGTPVSGAISPVATTKGFNLNDSTTLMVSACAALALIGLAIGFWRSRSGKSSRKQHDRHIAGARQDVTVRVQVAPARMIKTPPKPSSTGTLRNDEAAFERTLRDLETANRIL
jgi:hypothetical protein